MLFKRSLWLGVVLAATMCRAQPSNDQCLDAIPVAVNGPEVSGTTVGSTENTYCFPRFGAGPVGNGVFFVTAGTGNVMTVTTCSATTDFDSRISVQDGSCDADCVANEDTGVQLATCSNPRGRQYTFDSVAGRNYFIYVRGATSEEEGHFGVSVVDYPRPSNNQCLDADALEVNGQELTGTTVASTKNTRCFGRFGANLVGRGTYFSTVGTGNVMTVSTCSASTDYDSRLSIQDGSCDADCVANEDPGFNLASCANLRGQQATFDSVKGRVYQIYIYGKTNSDVGSFSVSAIDYPSPSNDQCLNATPIEVNGPKKAGTTVASTKNIRCFGRFGANLVGRGTYFVMAGTGNVMTVSTCHPETNFASRISIQDGSCDADCIFNVDPGFELTTCSNLKGHQVTFDSVAGQNYYIYVHGASNSDAGTFGLSVVDYQRPTNDHCLDAVAVVVDGLEVVGSTVNSTENMYCVRFGSGPVGRGVWFRAIGNGEDLTVSTCSATTNFVAKIGVQDGGCGEQCVTGTRAACPLNPKGETFTFASEMSVEYLVYVYGGDEPSVGNLGLQVYSVPPPNPLDDFVCTCPMQCPLAPSSTPSVGPSFRTLSEEPTDAPSDQAPFCFAGQNKIRTDRGVLTIAELKIGDRVHNGDGQHDIVYSFAHLSPDDVVNFLKISTSEHSIMLTPNHLLFTDAGAVPSSMVKVGDSVIMADGIKSTVQTVKHVASKGAFAPFTASGTIAVSGFKASNYVALQSEKLDTFEIGGIPVASMHWLAHVFQSAHRVVCLSINFEYCLSETYDDKGVSNWVTEQHRIAKWSLEKNDVVLALVFVPAFAVFGLVFAIEALLTSAAFVWSWTMLLVVGIWSLHKFRSCTLK